MGAGKPARDPELKQEIQEKTLKMFEGGGTRQQLTAKEIYDKLYEDYKDKKAFSLVVDYVRAALRSPRIRKTSTRGLYERIGPERTEENASAFSDDDGDSDDSEGDSEEPATSSSDPNMSDVPGTDNPSTDDGRDNDSREAVYYGKCGNFLKEVDEVTFAHAVGGNRLGGKWGTPDVIGVFKAASYSIIKFETQIVSVELKIDRNQYLTAFGQALAYCAFSHKSYVAIPPPTKREDKDVLEYLCRRFGLGLIYFEPDVNKPDWRLVLRATVFQPDYFRANALVARLKDSNESFFKDLFF